MDPEACREQLLQLSQNGKSLTDVWKPEQIEALAHHKDAEIRYLTAELLADGSEVPQAEDLLLELAGDPDTLVRVQAVDSLSAYPTEASFSAMETALDDPCELVRSYGALGRGWVGMVLKKEGTVSLLQKHREASTAVREQAACCEALYVLGRKEALEALLELFPEGDAQARCFILNGLQELVNPYALDRICRFLGEIPTADLPPAVRSSKEELTLTCRNFTR